MKKIIIVVGPSGAGKSSFVDKIVGEKSTLVDIKTCTTRPMRKGEMQGDPYHFLSEEEFEEKIEKGFFVEWARVHGKLYGTPNDEIYKAWEEGKDAIMDIDVQGAATFMKKFPKETRTIFVLPPSLDALRQRVIKRDGETVKDLDLRMKNAEKEVAKAGEFHYQVINDQFSPAYNEFKKIVEEIVARE